MRLLHLLLACDDDNHLSATEPLIRRLLLDQQYELHRLRGHWERQQQPWRDVVQHAGYRRSSIESGQGWIMRNMGPHQRRTLVSPAYMARLQGLRSVQMCAILFFLGIGQSCLCLQIRIESQSESPQPKLAMPLPSPARNLYRPRRAHIRRSMSKSCEVWSPRRSSRKQPNG